MNTQVGADRGPSSRPDRSPTEDIGRYRDDDRGVSAVVAIVLLTGIVTIGSVGILVVGGSVVSQTADTAETKRVELGFQQFGSEVEAVAAMDDGSRAVDLDLPSNGDGVIRHDDSGRIVVTRYNGSTTEVVNRSIGSVVYEHDGTRYAYEAGAVWRGTGRSVNALSPPRVTYRNATLTLPITDLSGDQRIGAGRFRIAKRGTVAPLNDVSIVRGELITVRITSDYYIGWANYFRQHVDDVSVTVDEPTRTVTIRLAEPVINGSFDTGLVASGDVNATNPSTTPTTGVRTTGTISGDIDCGGTCEENVADIGVEPIDATVEVRATTAKREVNETTTITGGETLTDGIYYVPNDTYLDGTSDVTVDLSDGDVTIVMDGNLGLKNTQLNVINGNESGNVLRVFMNHTDFAMSNGAGVYVEDGTAARLQMYGTSDMLFAMAQANDHGFTGVVYAPRLTPDGGDNEVVKDMDLDNAECATDFCIGKGSGDVHGGLVGGDLTIEQNSNFTYDSSLEHVDPSVDKSGMYPPPITYLHVSVNHVEVESAG